MARRTDESPSARAAAPRDLLPELGARVRELRRRAGLTQEALGARASLKAESISRIETGRACPDLPTLARLLVVLDSSFGEVLDPDDLRAPLTAPEARLLRTWRRLDARRRQLATDMVESLASAPSLAAEPDDL